MWWWAVIVGSSRLRGGLLADSLSALSLPVSEARLALVLKAVRIAVVRGEVAKGLDCSAVGAPLLAKHEALPNRSPPRLLGDRKTRAIPPAALNRVPDVLRLGTRDEAVGRAAGRGVAPVPDHCPPRILASKEFECEPVRQDALAPAVAVELKPAVAVVVDWAMPVQPTVLQAQPAEEALDLGGCEFWDHAALRP
jgi:hypothetical protein